jgi:hypothetical protein
MFRPRARRAVATPAAAPVPAAAPTGSILDQYVRDAPSNQLAVDVFAGEWSSRFPASWGLNAGQVPLFEDPRITWTIEQVGGVEGRRVLELGPLEAAHSAMLHQAGASVVAIEANTRAYLKCLIVKEIMHLDRLQVLLGDFVPYLEATDEHFDLLLASGVLYHSPDPVGLLTAMARVADRVAIWTHYWEPDVVAADEGKARMFVPKVEQREWRGHQLHLHRRNYLESLQWAGFCGGPESSALWMERADIITVLTELGLGRITVQSDDLENPNGACVMLAAER